MQHRSSVSWRQTLLSSLEAYGLESVDSAPGSARTDDMPFSYMGESCMTEQEAEESAACDIFIALLLATPRSVKMVHSCFEGGRQTVDEIRELAEHLQSTDQHVCSDARGELPSSTVDNDDASLEWFLNYLQTPRSPLLMNNPLEHLHPRLGLRDFVNRHLDKFEWLDEKNCQFSLKSRTFPPPLGLECFGRGCQTH